MVTVLFVLIKSTPLAMKLSVILYGLAKSIHSTIAARCQPFEYHGHRCGWKGLRKTHPKTNAEQPNSTHSSKESGQYSRAFQLLIWVWLTEDLSR